MREYLLRYAGTDRIKKSQYSIIHITSLERNESVNWSKKWTLSLILRKAIKLIGYKGNNNQKRVNLTDKNLTRHIKDQHFMYTRIPRAKRYQDKTDFVNWTRRRAINKISTHGNKCASAPLRDYNASNRYMTINAWTYTS